MLMFGTLREYKFGVIMLVRGDGYRPTKVFLFVEISFRNQFVSGTFGFVDSCFAVTKIVAMES